MSRNIEQLTSRLHDVVIIGGGINGAAIAHLSALNGLKVALLEKNDFASGTSSKSSKLIHGGLRYLENFEFDLVAEALKERTAQLQAAPHLVKPLGFIIPLYKNGPRSSLMMKIGVSLYDTLSGRHLIHPHRTCSKEEVIHFIPSINQEKLVGGIIYYDAQMDDARLCLENALRAHELGATVENYVQVKNFMKENGKAVGVIVQDRLTNRTFEIRAKKIVCTTGVWTDEMMLAEGGIDRRKIRMTKGVHIVVNKKVCEHALLLQTEKDHRIFFVIPYLGETLIGTTDTDYDGRPDNVSVLDEDVDYLLTQINKFFSEHFVTRNDIISSFAGLRPLVAQPGNPSGVSRKHVIRESFSGIVYVMGGKYTTYRKIAQDAMKVILKAGPIKPESDFRLFAREFSNEEFSESAEKYSLDMETVKHLQATYASRYPEVLDLLKENPGLKERIYPHMPQIKAQILYSLQNEKACNIEDVFERRLNLHYHGCDRERFNEVFVKLTA